MNAILSIVVAGFIGGVVMQVWVQLLHKVGFTSLNLIRYLGCIPTGKKTGVLNYIAGTAIHFAISLFDGFTYSIALKLLWGNTGFIPGLLFGIIHANGSGLAIVLFDYINPCVRSNAIAPIKLYAHGYGITAIITFMTSILAYGATTGALL